jgi:hypothetical protein
VGAAAIKAAPQCDDLAASFTQQKGKPAAFALSLRIS